MNESWNTRTRGITILALIALLAAGHFCAFGADAPLPEPSGPLTVDDCIVIALAQNPQLVSSEQNVVGAGAALTRARSPYYPQLTFGLIEAIGSDPVGDGTETTEEASFVLRQTIWQRGLRESRRHAG